jgi:hypothetical protein
MSQARYRSTRSPCCGLAQGGCRPRIARPHRGFRDRPQIGHGAAAEVSSLGEIWSSHAEVSTPWLSRHRLIIFDAEYCVTMRGGSPSDSRITRPSGTPSTRFHVILTPQASKGKGAGSMLKRRGSIFIGGKRVLEMGRRSFPDTRVLTSAGTSARGCKDRKEGKLRRKLFHREERPTLERHIIDTSEWTCANHRHVMEPHLVCEDIRAGSADLQLCAK